MEDVPFYLREHWFDALTKHIPVNNEEIKCLDGPGEAKLYLTKRQAHPLSGFEYELSSFTNYYSPGFGISNSVCCTPEEMVKHHLAFFKDSAQIHLVPMHIAEAKLWRGALEKFGFYCEFYQHSVNWFETGIGDKDSYWSERSTQLKNTLTRKRKRMARDHDFQCQVFSPATQSEFVESMSKYHHVYYHSWKRNEPFPAFIDSVAKHAMERGELRFGLLSYQDNPIAAQVWFVANRTAYIFKLSYVDSYKKFSAGTILTAALIDHVIEHDHVVTIDFLTGDDNYKKDWMSQHQEILGLIAVNKKSPIAPLRWLSRTAKTFIKLNR